jgi:hypothetical protein
MFLSPPLLFPVKVLARSILLTAERRAATHGPTVIAPPPSAAKFRAKVLLDTVAVGLRGAQKRMAPPWEVTVFLVKLDREIAPVAALMAPPKKSAVLRVKVLPRTVAVVLA